MGHSQTRLDTGSKRGVTILLDPTKSALPDSGTASETRSEHSAGNGRRAAYTIRTFAPEQWGQVDMFATFFSSSFPDAKSIERRAVSGVGNHFRKAMVLRSLSLRIAPTLAIDKQQLNEKGYTPAEHATELAAVVESVFTELYSAVDCARRILSARYPVRGMPDSTRKMFARSRSGTFDGLLPAGLLSAIKKADWYEPLRTLRDELTHSDIGSVHQDEVTGRVSYMHTGLGTGEKAFVIEDIFARMDADFEAVNRFLGVVFVHLNTLLTDAPTVQLCGLHQGKALIREIRPEPTLNFDSGKCLAVPWIEVDGKPNCPLLCGAYWRTKGETSHPV
jgi:hypothetical protein